MFSEEQWVQDKISINELLTEYKVQFAIMVNRIKTRNES